MPLWLFSCRGKWSSIIGMMRLCWSTPWVHVLPHIPPELPCLLYDGSHYDWSPPAVWEEEGHLPGPCQAKNAKRVQAVRFRLQKALQGFAADQAERLPLEARHALDLLAPPRVGVWCAGCGWAWEGACPLARVAATPCRLDATKNAFREPVLNWVGARPPVVVPVATWARKLWTKAGTLPPWASRGRRGEPRRPDKWGQGVEGEAQAAAFSSLACGGRVPSKLHGVTTSGTTSGASLQSCSARRG